MEAYKTLKGDIFTIEQYANATHDLEDIVTKGTMRRFRNEVGFNSRYGLNHPLIVFSRFQSLWEVREVATMMSGRCYLLR